MASPWQCAEEIQGWVTPDELQWLRYSASVCQTVLEIGSWKGRSTWALCESCPGTVHACDWWKGSDDEGRDVFAELEYVDVHQVFMNNVGHFPNLVVHKMKSRALAQHRSAPARVDMTFIDGDHSYGAVLGDLRDWGGRTNLLLCGHDANWPGVRKALDEYAPDQWSVQAGSIWRIDQARLKGVRR